MRDNRSTWNQDREVALPFMDLRGMIDAPLG